MELTVLGAEGGWPRPGRAACGYLLREAGFTLWVDAGTGTLANLQRHVDLLGVSAVVVSHRHFDHFLDLYPYHLAVRWDQGRAGRIPLIGPPGLAEHVARLEDALEEVFEPRVVDPGASFEAGPFRVRTAPMHHPVPTLGMRIQGDGDAVLAYSADTGGTDELVALAKGADLLLSEATWIERPDGWEPIHLEAGEAGEHAARAAVGRLLLTHVWPQLDRSASVERAAAAFGGPVEAAVEGMRIEVGSGVRG